MAHKRITTVGELRKKLAGIPSNTRIIFTTIDDDDIGVVGAKFEYHPNVHFNYMVGAANVRDPNHIAFTTAEYPNDDDGSYEYQESFLLVSTQDDN